MRCVRCSVVAGTQVHRRDATGYRRRLGALAAWMLDNVKVSRKTLCWYHSTPGQGSNRRDTAASLASLG